jgi:hypothetical protein
MRGSAGKLSRRPRLALLGLCLVAIGCLYGAGSASAKEFFPHVASGSFEGMPSGSVRDVATDDQSGAVYTVGVYEGKVTVFKFDKDGNPSAFTDPSLGGSNKLIVWSGEAGPVHLAVDNSNTATHGRIYVTNRANAENAKTFAFEASGKPVGGKYPIEAAGSLIAVDPTTGNWWMNGVNLVGHIIKFLPNGTETAQAVVLTAEEEPGENYGLDIGTEGNLFVMSYPYVYKVTPESKVLGRAEAAGFGGLATNQVNGNVVVDAFQSQEFEANLNVLPEFHDEIPSSENTTAAQNGGDEYLYVAKGGNEIFIFKPGPEVTLPDVEIGQPTNFEPTSVTLHATVNSDGVETAQCVFEYGTTTAYGETAPCEPSQHLTGNAPVAVSAKLTGITQGAIYHYRLVVENKEAAPNNTLKSFDSTTRPSGPPTVGLPYVDTVHADGAVFHDEIAAEGAPTTFHVLYGTADCVAEPGACTTSPESASIGTSLKPALVSQQITGLEAGTTYHYLFVATNQSGTSESSEQSFTTFPFNPGFEDNCANAHVRQQVGAALLPDCRAYELASDSNQNGYDVESYLVGGQTPFGGYPEASGKVLYAIHDGALSGTGNPTNRGLDPYVATRGEAGWTTKYVGIPATDPFSTESFGSPLLAADGSLNTFAFGGEGLCSPCFEDGSTGIPVTLPNGSLVQGMAGSEDPGTAAEPNMLAKKPLSANGVHLLFGSTEEFEAGAGSPAIYDRNLQSGTTHAVSKLPGGGAIPCLIQCETDGIAELDVSADGSHVVLGQLVGEDAVGNKYWHLYMNVNDSSQSIDLTPGTTEGALYDGMTSNGSTVYFTTVDQLTGEDTDGSADIYRADVSGSSASLTLVSAAGGHGNTDSCEPSGNSVDEFWNSSEGEENCGVVAVSGGGGVAAASGSIFFLSPELLAGNSEPQDGVVNAPNLYEAIPGSPLKYVTTLESTFTAPTPPVVEHRPIGNFAHTQNPKFVAVDNSGGPSDGDVYVADGRENVVRKYTPSGTLITSWADNGVLSESEEAPREPSEEGPFGELSGVAVGPDGTLYVAFQQYYNGAPNVWKFNPEGHQVGYLALEGQPQPIGISMDNQGRLFYGSYEERIYRWTPGKGATQISTWLYESGTKTGLAVDPISGDLYVDVGGEEVALFRFDSQERVIEAKGSPCASNCGPTEVFGAEEVTGASGMFVDPTTQELLVAEGNKIVRFDKFGKLAPGPAIGGTVLSNSHAVAVSNAGDVYATGSGSSGGYVEHFGRPVLAAEPQVDNPIVVHGVNDSGTRYDGDFQTNPGGADAVFPTTIPYSDFNNNGFEELFLYHGGPIECISCNPTGAKGIASAEMAPDGLSLLEDGRVFFDSNEALVPRDLDNRTDVYEWVNGKAELITTGISPYNSALLGASADGKDAFFFTRDQLTPQDNNGKLVKVYDARENGGFPYVPPEAGCKASDECHGPASQPGPTPGINTITGTRGNANEGKAGVTCKKGYVKQKGKCVKKKSSKKNKGKKKKSNKKQHKRAKSSAGSKGGANR